MAFKLITRCFWSIMKRIFSNIEVSFFQMWSPDFRLIGWHSVHIKIEIVRPWYYFPHLNSSSTVRTMEDCLHYNAHHLCLQLYIKSLRMYSKARTSWPTITFMLYSLNLYNLSIRIKWRQQVNGNLIELSDNIKFNINWYAYRLKSLKKSWLPQWNLWNIFEIN